MGHLVIWRFGDLVMGGWLRGVADRSLEAGLRCGVRDRLC